jgi:hypothetical protein
MRRKRLIVTVMVWLLLGLALNFVIRATLH